MTRYASTDWHGCGWIWTRVKEILKPDDILYFLGDAVDRGEDGWYLLNELLNDPRVIYLKGNHEDMMVQTIHFKDGKLLYNEHTAWWYNHCYSTIDGVDSDERSNEEIFEVIEKVKTLPFCAVYTNSQGQRILLSHAGCDSFEAADGLPEETMLWDRTHWTFHDDWFGEDDEYIVHGHTPIELMREEQTRNIKYYGFHAEMPPYSGHGAYWYGKGHKICIDTGAVWDNESVLLNLDTWEQTIIRKDEE